MAWNTANSGFTRAPCASRARLFRACSTAEIERCSSWILWMAFMEFSFSDHSRVGGVRLRLAQIAVEHHADDAHQQPPGGRHADPVAVDLDQALVAQSPQVLELAREVRAEVDEVSELDRLDGYAEVAGERLDLRAAHEVVGAELQAARHRQVAGIERGVVIVQPLLVLVIRRADGADRRYAEADEIALRLRRIALEVALQPPLALRDGEIVVGPREVVHADIEIAGAREPAQGKGQDLQARLRRRQIGRHDAPLWLEPFGQVRVGIKRDAIRVERDHAVEGAAEAVEGLLRQTVDEVEVDRAHAVGARLGYHAAHQILGLHAVHGLLHVGVEVLHAERHAVESEAREMLQGAGWRMARIDFDGALGLGGNVKPRAQRGHQPVHLGAAQESRRAASQMKLGHGGGVEERRQELQFPLEVADILGRPAVVTGHDLVAAAVVADALAEGQMDVDGKGLADAAGVALRQALPQLGLAESLDETVGRGIRGVARAGLVVSPDQHRVDGQFGRRIAHGRTMDAGDRSRLISVNKGLLRHAAMVGAGAAALAALLALNALAFVRGVEAPWLLGGVLIADMLVIGVGVLLSAREVLTAREGTALARVAMEQSEARLAAIVEWSQDAIIGLSLDGVITSWNRGAEKAFGYRGEEALGNPISLIVPQARRAEEDEVLAKIGRGETVEHFETQRCAKDGRVLDIALTVSPIRDAAGVVVGASKISRDITLRKHAEADAVRMRSALTAAQARLAAIIDSAMDAVITVDQAQKIVLFNRAAEQVFGVRHEEAIGAALERFIPARFRAAHAGDIDRFGKTGVTSRRMGDVTTLWALRADGSEFPIEASISQAAQDGEHYYTVILRDITVRKQYEDELKRQQQELRELSARVLEAREEEKAGLARELHDELGQLLTALKMDLSWLRERIAAVDLAKKADEMSALLDQTVMATRRISADLRPLMLDDLGLADAASWLVEDFAKRSGIECRIELPPADALVDLSKSVSTALYRAVQESLTNIARHAQARRAWVMFAVDNGHIHVEVEDDGRGIAAEDLAKPRSLGLKGMRERVAYLGGSLEIARGPRGGTRICLRVPARRVHEETA